MSTSRPTNLLTGALTNSISPRFNDLYDADDILPPLPQQRQQQQHQLRRSHIEATSAGFSPPPRDVFVQQQPRRQRSDLTNDFEDELESTTQSDPSSPGLQHKSDRSSRPAPRISRNTHSAILYTLEEALRTPNQFTPDLVEENSQMSGLRGGPLDGRGNNDISISRPVIPNPGTSGSPRIKGPQDIMRERTAREARKKQERDEKEAMERRNAEEEARQIELERRRSVERRAAAAGAIHEQGEAEDRQQRVSGGTTGGPRISDNSQRSQRQSGNAQTPMGGGRRPQAQSVPIDPGPSGAAPSTTAQGSAAAPMRSSFPHAFERWETLSAHWEGLTSFWIRRLEENSTEVSRDPLSQQLSRQVTDLSAAGANLFHAVVELQRLRASSERKFQRWFFETRAEQERTSEVQAMLQSSLERVKLEHKAELANLAEKERAKYEQRETEMKRELQISKEEAKRAWEELGRREQEERERTTSLREGQPTIVGGVQVVPMMQGIPSRGNSISVGAVGARDIPPTRDGPPSAGGPSTLADPFVEPTRQAEVPRSPPASAYTTSSSAQHPAFTTSHEYAQAPAVQPAMSSAEAFYQQLGNRTLQQGQSENAFSEEDEYEIDDQGRFILDAQGNKIRYQGPVSDDDTDEYDVSDARERERANSQRYPPISGMSGVEYGHGSTATSSGIGSSSRSSAPTSVPSTGQPVDYTGQAYGSAAPEWAAVPRHSHPTRLSDVLEEDERSRTSASQLSRH